MFPLFFYCLVEKQGEGNLIGSRMIRSKLIDPRLSPWQISKREITGWKGRLLSDYENQSAICFACSWRTTLCSRGNYVIGWERLWLYSNFACFIRRVSSGPKMWEKPGKSRKFYLTGEKPGILFQIGNFILQLSRSFKSISYWLKEIPSGPRKQNGYAIAWP